jgi:hypothetical protein
MDNEPIELARTALAGLRGTNPRNGSVANRAVLLIDPFGGKSDPGPATAQPIVKMALDLFMGLVGQSRFATDDVYLANDPTVFSRFMISGQRVAMDGSQKFGEEALASAGLFAILGFACRDYRVHDYLLGRQNAWAYLKNELVLPEANIPVFQNNWTGPAIAQFAVTDAAGVSYLPLIPLYGSAAAAPQTVDWPMANLDPSIYRDAIEKRFTALVSTIETGGIGSLIESIAAWAYKGKVANMVVESIQNYIDKHPN